MAPMCVEGPVLRWRRTCETCSASPRRSWPASSPASSPCSSPSAPTPPPSTRQPSPPPRPRDFRRPAIASRLCREAMKMNPDSYRVQAYGEYTEVIREDTQCGRDFQRRTGVDGGQGPAVTGLGCAEGVLVQAGWRRSCRNHSCCWSFTASRCRGACGVNSHRGACGVNTEARVG
jgi:hypothetical protein